MERKMANVIEEKVEFSWRREESLNELTRLFCTQEAEAERSALKLLCDDDDEDEDLQVVTRTVIQEASLCFRKKRKRQRTQKALPSKRRHQLSLLFALNLLLLLSLVLSFSSISVAASHQQQSPLPLSQVQTILRDEYQLVGQANEEAHLPCLIGRQLYCGEPYFIAWYKFNSTSKSWLRIEHKSEEELAASNNGIGGNFNERVRFTWPRGASAGSRSACEQARGANGGGSRLFEWSNFDCAQLTISRLELADEGQYKCEITFSESLDFDKCPATTLSQLSVIARPNEPELLVNGRLVVAATATAAATALQTPLLTFKEGAQVRLECQSSGGKPAPRIEWLNVSWPQPEASEENQSASDNNNNYNVDENELAGQNLAEKAAKQLRPAEVQLMRVHWPTQKKATLQSASLDQNVANFNLQQQQSDSTAAAATAAGLNGPQATPITSSSVTISLSRYDLNSQFVCLVLPATTGASLQHAEQLIKSPAYLRALLSQQQQHRTPAATGTAPMLKWMKLNVQVKPSRVSVVVRDAKTNATIQPIQWQPHQQQQQQTPLGLFGPASAFVEHQMSPFYSLQLNRLYAIQCIAENSRPRSRVSWFNRTAPIGLPQVQLNNSASDYLVPADDSHHRLSSFTRTTEHANGTFRTSATLLLTTNVWDNFEELFCRISNEAFQFDELIQVAPIISARLYVNYSPFAWLEADGVKWTDSANQVGRLKVDQGTEFTLRCQLAANPLNQNTIIQIEWLKDGRKLATSSPTNSKQQQASSRIQIEKANHLHMPLTQVADASSSPSTSASAAPTSASSSLLPLSSSSAGRHKSMLGNQLVDSSKLIGASSLTISALTKADSGSYSCQYKLIPAPTSAQVPPASMMALQASSAANQQQQQTRITSGQANQAIQVNVIEAKPRAPILRVSSSKGLLVYGLESPPSGNRDALAVKQQQQGQQREQEHRSPWPTVLVEPGAEISLKCDLPASIQQQQPIGHKVMWYLDGAFIHSNAGSSDTYNFTIGPVGSTSKQLGTFSCAHQLLASPTTAAPGGSGSSSSSSSVSIDNFHGSLIRVFQSTNQIDLKIKVGPKMLSRRDLVPPVRSFSELELSANSASELRLVCLAQCEPICSIDWYLNERPLATATAAAPIGNTNDGPRKTRPALSSNIGGRQWLSTVSVASHESDNSLSWTTIMPGNQTMFVYRRAREFPFEPLGAAPLASSGGAPLVLVENVIHRRNESSRFTWLRESSLNVIVVGGGVSGSTSTATESSSTLASSSPLSPSETSAFERLSWQLRREASAELSSNDANVFSKLELTYNQISQLLLRQKSHGDRASSSGVSATNGNGASDNNGDQPLLIKCKLNKVLNGAASAGGNETPLFANGKSLVGNNNNGSHAFGHARVERGHWFPAANAAASIAKSGADKDDDHRYQLAMSNGPLDLAALYGNDGEDGDNETPNNSNNHDEDASKRTEIDNESRNQVQRKQQLGKTSQSGESSFVDEMQIRILLDRAPKSVSMVGFGGIVTTTSGNNDDEELARLTLTESQLLEIADPNKATPLLRCRANGAPYPAPQFKWTFTDLNRTQHSITGNGSELNLRQFIELRQRQLNVDPMSAYGVDVVANIVGNYTCIATNVNGSKSTTLNLQIQGRPLCKLTLGGEYLGAENELMANLRCTIYSVPPVLETVWFRNNQQLAVNKSSSDMLSWASRLPVSIVEYPVMVLSKQQDFMLSDLMTHMANFKCIARNPHGYSEACELNQAGKQTLLNTFKPMAGLGAKTTSPALSMVSYPDQNKLGMSPVLNYISNGSSLVVGQSDQVGGQQQQPVSALMRGFFTRLDWLIVTGCSLAFVWLLFVASTSFIRRRFLAHRKFRTKASSGGNNNTSWRFNTTRTNSSNEVDIGAGPFQSKICVNYYGGSNGDSEHDIMQSCNSQSSHYEEFAQQQLHQQQQQKLVLNQQPLYFNQMNHSTLNRRALKSSLSTSSTGDSSTDGRQGQQQQLARLGELPQARPPILANTMLGDHSHYSGHYNPQTNHLAATMRESLSKNRLSNGGGLTLTSNVPLINGTHNSRINLDQQQRQRQAQQHYRFNRDHHQQQTFNSSQIRNNEHIYDDIIYNQIIL